MSSYAVTLFGNRKGATIGKDYAVLETNNYSAARKAIVDNGGWGNIKEYNNHYDAIKANNDFILEVRGVGLSVKRLENE